MIGLILRIANQVTLGRISPVKITKTASSSVIFDVPFRCWPVDIDAFMHMNNAMYVRVAELARWRIFLPSDTVSFTSKKGILFLVVENDLTYNRPIMPFQKYIVRTTVTSTDNKWIFYEHKFIQHPDKVKAGQEAQTYATVVTKAVMKEKSGKTVRLTEVENDFYQSLVPKKDS